MTYLNRVFKMLNEKFDIKNLGPISKFLGVELEMKMVVYGIKWVLVRKCAILLRIFQKQNVNYQ